MKKTIKKALIGLSLLVGAALCGHAQAITSEDIKAQLVKDWERAKAYTIDYLNSMPADKYSFKPVDSIRSFVQQMLHLASGNTFLMPPSAGQKPLVMRGDLETSAGAQSKDSVMYFVTASYDYCINAVKSTDVKTWGEKGILSKVESNRYVLMTKAFEHQTHHRGQATIYIRLQGIRPPGERLF